MESGGAPSARTTPFIALIRVATPDLSVRVVVVVLAQVVVHDDTLRAVRKSNGRYAVVVW